ncbi:spore coat polysaccharide biosynthesis protein SpsF [Gammaproteobacteria bacterium]
MDDIAARLHGASRAFGADVIVRVWGDCPCVDPVIINVAVERLLAENLDYISNSIAAGRTYPYGLDIEVYRATLLEHLCAATTDPFYREFPFEWVMAHHAELRMGTLRLDEDWSHIHLTVDYPEDLALIREVYQALHHPGTAFGWREAVAWLAQQPKLALGVAGLARNPEYHQKSAARTNQVNK